MRFELPDDEIDLLKERSRYSQYFKDKESLIDNWQRLERKALWMTQKEYRDWHTGNFRVDYVSKQEFLTLCKRWILHHDQQIKVVLQPILRRYVKRSYPSSRRDRRGEIPESGI